MVFNFIQKTKIGFASMLFWGRDDYINTFPSNNIIMNTPLPYTAISLSVVGRLIFMFLLYRNRSTNSLSLLFCLLNICSSSMWIYYSVQTNDIPMISRSSTEITLLFISAVYIIRNKLVEKQQVLPI